MIAEIVRAYGTRDGRYIRWADEDESATPELSALASEDDDEEEEDF
jgi:hypothetical protein